MSTLYDPAAPERAAAYIRTSSGSDDPESGHYKPADDQETAIRKINNGEMPSDVWRDIGTSGRKDAREEYGEMRKAIRAGRYNVLYAYDISRLARHTRELLDLVDECRAHGVVLRIAKEGIDTGSAVGRFFLTVMGGLAEMYAETASERALEHHARVKDLYAKRGLRPTGHSPLYGMHRIGTRKRDGGDGTFVYVRCMPGQTGPHDWPSTASSPCPGDLVGPVLQAYADAGSVRGAVVLLDGNDLLEPNRTGTVRVPARPAVPGPKGGQWGSSTLSRILRQYAEAGLLTLPEPRGRGARHPIPQALFGGLLTCHCGRRMTPNRQRGQYYCAAGHDAGGREAHGRWIVAESTIRTALESALPPADFHLDYEAESADLADRRRDLQARIGAATDALMVPGADTARIAARIASLNAQLTALGSAETRHSVLRIETRPAWTDVPAMNAWLRRFYPEGIALDAAMVPTVPPFAYPEQDMPF